MAVASRRGDARLLSVVTMGGGRGASALCAVAARMSASAEMVAVSRRLHSSGLHRSDAFVDVRTRGNAGSIGADSELQRASEGVELAANKTLATEGELKTNAANCLQSDCRRRVGRVPPVPLSGQALC